MSEKVSGIKQWRSIEKLLFRFVFIFFFLFVILVNNPFFTKFLSQPLHLFIPWFAEKFLALPYSITIFTNGSGDTSYDYVLLLCISITSLAGCFIWSLADRKRLNYERLFYVLTVIVRFYVGLMLIQYGIGKIIKVQFPFPDLGRLTSSYGESTPMGLAWTFLGFSKGYNLFMGIIELMGILLLFRRTVILGAVICLMTTAQIMAINYFYDVPVKILSTTLFIMCLFLLVQNLQPLGRFFLKGEAVQLNRMKAPVINKKWLIHSKLAFQLVFISIAIFFFLSNTLEARNRYGDAVPRLPLYGVYQVESFISTKDSLEIYKKGVRWQKLIIQHADYSSVKYTSDYVQYCSLKVDTANKTINIAYNYQPDTFYSFTYQIPDNDQLVLSGTLEGDPVTIILRKQKINLGETFKWINEHPNNH